MSAKLFLFTSAAALNLIAAAPLARAQTIDTRVGKLELATASIL